MSCVFPFPRGSFRSIESLDIVQVQPVVQTSCLALLGPETLFLGSRLGDSILVQCQRTGQGTKRGQDNADASVSSKVCTCTGKSTAVGPLVWPQHSGPVPAHGAGNQEGAGQRRGQCPKQGVEMSRGRGSSSVFYPAPVPCAPCPGHRGRVKDTCREPKSLHSFLVLLHGLP